MFRGYKSNVPQYINFDWETYQKLFYFCQSAPGEISGFAKVEMQDMFNGERRFHVIDARIFKQRNTHAHTTIGAKQQADFLLELALANQNPAQWCLWWHTHNDFDAFFSGEDVATIERLSRETKLISVCINKFGNMTARYDSRGFSQVLTPVVLPIQGTELEQKCKEEVKLKVKEEVYRYRTYKRRGSHAKRKRKYQTEEEPLSSSVGLGQSEETNEFPDYYGGSWSNREFHDIMPL